MTFSSFGSTIGTLGASQSMMTALGAQGAVFGPLGPIVGGAVGGIADIFIGGAQRAEAGRQQRRAAQRQQKANKKQWRFENKERNRLHEHQVKSLEIQKENNAANRQFQIDNLNQQRDYQMGIRDFEFNQAMRVFDSQMETFTQQRGFNEIAEQMAMQQQDRKKYEDLIGMEFDKAQTLLNYTAATAGLNLKKASAKASADIQLGKLQDTTFLAMDAARTKTAFGKRQANIEALKASGQVGARGGAGVSVGKAQQGIKAELGAAKAQMSNQLLQQQREAMTNMVYNQRAIVNQLLTAEADADLNLANLNYQLDLDQAKMAISRDNLLANDKLIRDRIKMQRKQADINNEARKPLEPQKTPPIPEVIEPPIPQYAKIFKPGEPPEPKKKTAYTPNNPYGTLGQIAGVLGGAVGSDPFQNFLTQMMTPKYDYGKIGATFNPNAGLGIASTAGFNLNGFGNLSPVGFQTNIANPAGFNLNQNFF